MTNSKIQGISTVQQEEAGIDESDIFHILGNDRRREIVTRLATESSGVSVSELASEIAEREAGEETSEEELYKSVYVSLQQTHLPKLVEEDVVRYDKEAKRVAPGPRLGDVRVYVDEPGSWHRLAQLAPVLASLVGLVVVLSAWGDAPFVGSVDVAAWAVGFLVLIALTNLFANVE